MRDAAARSFEENAIGQARLIELDSRYCDVIIQRWQAWTGEVATLEADGHSFDETAAQRSDASHRLTAG